MLLHGYGIEHLLVMLLHGYGIELTSRTRSLHFLREFTLHLNLKVTQHFSNKDISKYSERSYFFLYAIPYNTACNAQVLQTVARLVEFDLVIPHCKFLLTHHPLYVR